MIGHFPEKTCCQFHLADFDIFIYSHFHAWYLNHIFLVCYCVAKISLIPYMTIHVDGWTGVLPTRNKPDIAIRWLCFALGPFFIKTSEHLNTCVREMTPTGGTEDRSVSYPFFSGYERDEAFPQDTDLSPVPQTKKKSQSY